ncbi:cyclic pyranopterin monophosphate synthase MoaC [Methanosalsum natronophilum]|uniref:Probable cyclic pyranopterin monophosphate synthase n=1 Tax=Methanosalsum natronophilum TaxID=768733 RepID=A0A424Z4P2_9EURY|nr:cyclic pyranopterin monophosphate synthase MoaC [Methanosalsum natronophilum]MCS3923999.1 cyclic pyranopterin phosphate synthase [Methanosalsum natronophilum]RQD91252.1 MAG: cyclic pyranopterin monophosphate synthase MoaC [Methanosalsum natronophilum]
MGEKFTHIKEGKANMVDITDKKPVHRKAVSTGSIYLSHKTLSEIKNKKVEKGDVFSVARIASILAIKKTFNLIPMCHQIEITSIDVDFSIKDTYIMATVIVKSTGKTGVEMEALTGVSIALLTIWDMVKSIEKDSKGNYPNTEINGIKVEEKIKESF